MIEKPSVCSECPLNKYTGQAFVPPQIGTGSKLIVGEAPGEEEEEKGVPFAGGAGTWLNNILKASKQNREEFSVVNTICCRPPANVYPGGQLCTYCTKDEAQAGIKYCHDHIVEPFLTGRDWSAIYAVGGKALTELTGRTGIEQWRGSPLPLYGGSTQKVIPTIHPAALMRNAKLLSVAIRDFAKLPNSPPEHYNLYPRLDELQQFTATRFAFDFEWDWTGQVTLCGLSSKLYEALVVPFVGRYIDELRRIFENAEEIIGHNIITADTRYIENWGWDISKAKLVDTLLMQHLVQPDLRHGLSFVASVFTNKVFWKGADKEDEESGAIGGPQYKTWNKSYAIPRELGGYGGCSSEEEAYRLYNARDTDASYQIYWPLTGLIQRYNLENTYENVSVPIGYICRDLGDKGLKINKAALIDIREDLNNTIQELDAQLPEGLKSRNEYKVGNSPNLAKHYKIKKRTCKGQKNTKHEPVVLEFERPGVQECPVCKRVLESGKMIIPKTVKTKIVVTVVPWNSSDMVLKYVRDRGLATHINIKTQRESADKNARKKWIKTAPEFILVDQIKKASTLKSSFAKPGLVNTDRMYFNLLPHGTAEGRLSSTGKRDKIDLNIQNVPGEMKKIFTPDFEDWCFGDFDISQGENRLTAWFAKDFERLERLADPDYDEHSETATACFGTPVTKSNSNKHLRKAGKIINHMLNYGAGWKKLQEVLASEGFVFSAQECKDLIWEWKQLNARTAAWQSETIGTATAQGYLCNPFGRRRWFQTRDLGPKALAFLPASTLADAVLRMMIAMHSTKFSRQLNKLGIAERMDFTSPWRMVTQIHDSIVVTGPSDSHIEEFANVRRVMQQSWPELDGFRFAVEGKLCMKNLGEGVKI